MKKAILFLRDAYIDLFCQGFSHLNEEFDIQKVYIIGTMQVEEIMGNKVSPMNALVEIISFDDILMFTAILIEDIQKILNKIYTSENFVIHYMNDIMTEYFSGNGKIMFLKLYIDSAYSHRWENDIVQMGDFSYNGGEIQVMTQIVDGSAKVKIGKFCSIGPDLLILLGEEHHGEWATTYPFRSLTSLFGTMESGYSRGDVHIGNDVWIGQRVTILSGVTIGDGCIIGAGAVISKSVDPYSIVVGNPGQVVKKRFKDDKIEKLMDMQWWDWDYQMLYDALPLVQSSNIDGLWNFWKAHISQIES